MNAVHRLREWKRWFALRATVTNWLRSWLVSTSAISLAGTHRHDDPALSKARHTVRFRSGMTLTFAVDQWHAMAGLAQTCDRYLERLTLELNPGDIVVDVGAHVGTFIVPLCFQRPGMRAIAYEPDEDNAVLLEHNVAENSLQHSVAVHRQAVSGVSGRQDLLKGPTSTTGTLAAAGYVKNRAFMPTRSVEVETITLEDAFAQHKIERCQLLKMDCEGGEYDALEATPQCVWDRIDAAVVEVHPLAGRRPQEILDMLAGQGFFVAKDVLKNGCWEIFARR